MEWWQSGLSALAGVIVGALFTYLGLRSQLKQQKEINVIEWRRKVRGEPLLNLRAELVRMAAKQDKLAAAAYRQLNRIGVTEEQARAELQSAMDDWNTYVSSGDFARTLFMQYDAELVNKIEGIRKDYQESNFVALYFQIVKDAVKLSEAMKIIEKNKARIFEVQEIINKKLEEL